MLLQEEERWRSAFIYLCSSRSEEDRWSREEDASLLPCMLYCTERRTSNNHCHGRRSRLGHSSHGVGVERRRSKDVGLGLVLFFCAGRQNQHLLL